MCSTPKIFSIPQNTEVIKTPTRADAASQKATASNRTGAKTPVSENIKTSTTGLEDEITSSKKKLLGE